MCKVRHSALLPPIGTRFHSQTAAEEITQTAWLRTTMPSTASRSKRKSQAKPRVEHRFCGPVVRAKANATKQELTKATDDGPRVLTPDNKVEADRTARLRPHLLDDDRRPRARRHAVPSDVQLHH